MKRMGLLGLMCLALTLGACGDDEDTTEVLVDAQCGDVECGSGGYCCDAACGLCVEMEVACNMTSP